MRHHATTRPSVQIDDDPLYEDYPIRGFPTDIGLAGCLRSTLVALNAALGHARLDHDAIESRRRRWKTAHDRLREDWKTAGDGVVRT